MEYNTQPDIWFSSLKSGKFKKGHRPHNKGKKWSEYMSEKGQQKILQTLNEHRAEAIRVRNERNPIGGCNKKHVFAIKDGQKLWFESATAAADALNLIRRNVCHCAKGERKFCGGWKFKYTKVEK